MESAIFGFLGVIIGALIAVFKDYYFQKKKDEKNAKYLATVVLFELERYASACADVVGDNGLCEGQPDPNGYYTVQVPIPKDAIYKMSWTKAVDEKLKNDLELTAHAAYDHGCELIKDARMLFESHRYSTALALAILAEEEFSKAFTLKQSAENLRWDSTVYNSLRDHASKQGLAQAVVNYIAWEKARARASGGFKSAYPDANKVREIVAAEKAQLNQKLKDRRKQDALYVSITKDGKIQSLPKKFIREDAEKGLLDTENFQDNVALLLGDQDALERFFKL
ncbi:abortive infection protein, AbiV family [Methylophilus rhizosphaerae]|uniref:Abortive infection protein, AbiV family n=1 Tax=Methylophilus rhizosphaerae TaxID=492660 RepID=A0A1G8Z0I6_9PROT|nr:AbiV family abortive infection protein [Methylophilus rhizosphaerae]SDK08154.1 abortive infection protein, AbiV family [Methylophilus rhizosphaerae]